MRGSNLKTDLDNQLLIKSDNYEVKNKSRFGLFSNFRRRKDRDTIVVYPNK